MIYTLCEQCGLQFAVIGDPTEFGILKDQKWSAGYPCARMSCGGTAKVTSVPAGNCQEISLGAYYRAINGLSFGRSTEAGPGLVVDFLKNKKIVDAEVEPVFSKPMRTILKSILFEDGTRMHLANSDKGACVFVIEEAGDFNAIDRMVANRDSQSSDETGAQVGHHSPRAQSPGERVPHNSTNDKSKLGPSVGQTSEVLPSEPN